MPKYQFYLPGRPLLFNQVAKLHLPLFPIEDLSISRLPLDNKYPSISIRLYDASPAGGKLTIVYCGKGI